MAQGRLVHTKYRELGPLKRYADFLQVVSLIQSFIYTSRLNHTARPCSQMNEQCLRAQSRNAYV